MEQTKKSIQLETYDRTLKPFIKKYTIYFMSVINE